MFDLADAMIAANEELEFNRNPADGQQVDLPIRLENNKENITIRLTYIGGGAFTKAFLAADGTVVLATREEPPYGEMTKRLLSMLQDTFTEDNRYLYVNIPDVTHLGQTGFVIKGKATLFEVYTSPLYKAPLPSNAPLDAKKQAQFLRNRIKAAFKKSSYDKVSGAMFPQATCEEFISNIYKDISKYKYKPFTGCDPMKWLLFIQSVLLMIELSELVSNTWLMEAPNRNLALDDDGNLILLDIFFDYQSLINRQKDNV